MFDDILFEQHGPVGLITLNRVKALNALSHDMVKALAAQLDIWAGDETIKVVVQRSASEKAFSAGGDIRALYEGKGNPPYAFFWDEYRLNTAIHRYPKPFVSLINGIVMGGGVGISMHGQYVVGGERITFAMPEVGIGFFPDVGGSYLLSRMPKGAGCYCAMTGSRLKQGDCAHYGLITHAIGSDQFETIIERLIAGEKPGTVLDALNQDVAPTLDEEAQAVIEEDFSTGGIADIVATLKADARSFAARTLEGLGTKSPTSIHVAYQQVKRGGDLSFEECMQMEYRIVHRILEEEDFYEGVRATIIDKDGAPDWNPADLESVSASHVEAHFAPLAIPELTFAVGDVYQTG